MLAVLGAAATAAIPGTQVRPSYLTSRPPSACLCVPLHVAVLINRPTACRRLLLPRRSMAAAACPAATGTRKVWRQHIPHAYGSVIGAAE
jgi:hypothetical protein